MGVKEFIKKVPIPICGLALGLASLDRFLLVWEHSEFYTVSICVLFSFLIAVLFTLRLAVDFRGVLKDTENPALFAVLPTYTMTLMLLSAHAEKHIGGLIGDIAFVIWTGAVIASFVFMFFFVKRFFLRFSTEKVLPSWIIIFVGYVVGSTTSPVFGMQTLGQALFWSGFICYLLMLPLLVYRTVVMRKIPEPFVPTVAILAAPVNLCVVGCLTVYEVPPEAVVALLAIFGVISYVAVIGYLPVMLNRKFYPSFAALTFPLVISAVSFYNLGLYYGFSSDAFNILQAATVVIAAAVVAYVLIRYMMFLYRTARSTKASP
jgi:exfoliative toxin A/B